MRKQCLHSRYLAVILIVSTLCGCPGATRVVEDLNNKADKATTVLENGILAIQQDSAKWQTVLSRVATNLPSDISQAIRTDAQNLAQRSVAATGVEFRCNTDFLANRAIAALENLKAQLKGVKPKPLPPVLCQITPDAIDLKAPPDAWAKLTLHGYDLDHADTHGNRLKLNMVDAKGNSTALAEDRIGRTTHYQVTVNLGNLANEFHTQQIQKIVASWDDSKTNLSQIVVLPWASSRRVVEIAVGRKSYMPPKTGKPDSDADFDTHDDEPMSVEVRGEFQINATTILCRVYMHAREERDDWTEVGGWSDWSTVYTAPQGWKITEVNPRVAAVHTSNINSKGLQNYDQPAGEIVSRFEVWGDQNGDEAGVWTRVDANFRPISVTIEQTAPAW